MIDGSNAGGWSSSSIRQNICPNIFNALPDEWKNIITPCKKFTDNVGGGVDDSNFVTSSFDKIFLLSEYEIFGKMSYANSAEQDFQACNWWLRSPQSSIRERLNVQSYR